MAAAPSPDHADLPLWLALVPVLMLTGLLAASVYLFGEDSSYGANQIALVLAGGVAALIGTRLGFGWKELERAMIRGIASALPAVLILLSVGALIGVWMLSGTVPYLILLAGDLLSPSWFYAATCLASAVVALSIGSSWTTAGTLGVAMVGAATALDLSVAITAGAVISGAYFGDKMSPLSDTTNLAAGSAGADLFAHISHMIWTSGPALLLALVFFVFIGGSEQEAGLGFAALKADLAIRFNLAWYTLLPLLVLLGLSIARHPPVPTIWAGIAAGVLVAWFGQWDTAAAFGGRLLDGERNPAVQAGAAVWVALFNGYQPAAGTEQVETLLGRGGMASMLNTTWLIVTAMVFGAVMEHTGLLARLVRGMLAMATSRAGLITSTATTGVMTNLITADQYMSVILPGRLYQDEYRRRGFPPVTLSRTMEDSGTLTSVLVPWNTCGAFMAGTLGVPTLVYLPFCFFNFASLGFTLLWAWTGIAQAPRLPAPEDAGPEADGAPAEAAQTANN